MNKKNDIYIIREVREFLVSSNLRNKEVIAIKKKKRNSKRPRKNSF